MSGHTSCIGLQGGLNCVIMQTLENLFAEKARLGGSALSQLYDKNIGGSHRMDRIIPQKPSVKQCSACQIIKTLEEFYLLGKQGGKQRGYQHICIACAKLKSQRLYRKTYLPRVYRITEEEYERMWQAQDGRCAICHCKEEDAQEPGSRYMKFSVDHNHKTGQVRELLCHACNHALGCMQEDPERIKALLRYAEKWKKTE